MELFRNLTTPLTALDRPRVRLRNRTPNADATEADLRQRVQERRRQADRRQRNQAFEGPDRRQRRFRRSPVLLDRSARATALEDRRGTHISTRA